MHKNKSMSRFEVCEMFTRHFLFLKKYSYFTLWIIYKEVKNEKFKECLQSCKSDCLPFYICPSVCVSYNSTFHLSVAWNPEPAGRIYVSFSLMRFCSKICPENSHLVKIGQKNEQFIWRTKYIQDYMVASVSDL